VLQLVFELLRGPTGIAEEDSQRSHIVRHLGRVESDVDRAEIVKEGNPTFACLTAATRERDDGIGRHRPAEKYVRRLARVSAPVRQHLIHCDRPGTVEHQTERAFGAVLENEDDRAIEVRIGKRRCGDQQPTAHRAPIRSRSLRWHTQVSRMHAPPSLPIVLDELRAAVGVEHVLTDADVIAGYAVDWTGRFRGTSAAVVRPASVQEVAAVLEICNEARVAVVPQGGNTGLVGGSVPLHGEIVLSLRRLGELGAIDDTDAQVTVGAGVTLGRLQRHARHADWQYGVDLAARESATVGGMIATNAGGVHVMRHGPTRRQVLGVQAVLADGSVVERLGGLEKDNTGYDLAGLICGSEGTLAVVTAARLRLVPSPQHVVVALLAFDSVDAALESVGRLRRDVDTLQALELFEREGVDLVCAQLDMAPPFPHSHGAYVLVEAAGGSDPTDALAAGVEGLAGVREVAVATDPRGAEALWRYREAHSEAINQIGLPHKLDVTLPAHELSQFFARVRPAIASVAPAAQVWLFGHAADGNVHVNVTGVAPEDERVTDVVLHLVVDLNGSISAEHGIGTAKRRWVSLTRSPAELRAYRAIKQALDPRGILNPHVLLPDE
jgi:FAD/FMN-containing dehydrogenase